MQSRLAFIIPAACLFLSLPCCPGHWKDASTAKQTGKAAPEIKYLEDIDTASQILPPVNLAIIWVDVKSLRGTDLWTDVIEEQNLKLSHSNLPVQNILDKTDHAVVAVYPSKAGLESIVLAEGSFDPDETFNIVKNWAKGIEAVAQPVEIKNRRAVRIKGNVFMRLTRSLYASGSETLASYCADLIDKKRTGNASSKSIEYLINKSVTKKPLLVSFIRIPPPFNDWLKARRIDSLIGGSLMLSMRYDKKISFNLGVLPGKDIRPIWLANELHTFFIRSAKDSMIKKLKLEKWVENLDAKLLGRGVVVKGDIEKEKLVEIVKEMLP